MKYLKLKFLLMFFALAMAIPPAWAETKTAGFDLGVGGTVPVAVNKSTGTINGTQGETWNVTIDGNLTSSSFQGPAAPGRYWQMGKKDSSIEMATFTTSGINGTITEIVVDCAAASGPGGSVSVDVNNNTFADTQSMPNWNNGGGEVTFTGSASGTISIKLFPIQKRACYIKSITVTYEDNTPPSTDPWITVTPDPLNIDDDGGVFTVSAANMPNNGLGALIDTSSPSNAFSFTKTNDNTFNDGDKYFPLTENSNQLFDLASGTVQVNYTGHALSAAGVIKFASGSESATADVNYLYDGDIYIVGDVEGSGWSTEGDVVHGVPLVKNADGTYSATVTATAGGEGFSWLYFTKSLNASNYDDLGYNRFGPAGDDGSWSYNSVLNGVYCDLDTEGNLHTIKMAPGQYTITINPATNKFKITKVLGPVTYVKVTSTDDLTDGNYLIVYETGNVALDGSLQTLDATGNTQHVDIDNETIETADPIYFTYDANAKTLKSASGFFIGHTGSKNTLDQSATADAGFTNNITFDSNGNALINVDDTYQLRFNKNSGQERFRYFSGTNQQLIQLYKEYNPNKVATPTFSPAAGTYTSAQTVTISCATDGATIYYSTDGGNTWTEGNTVTVGETKTIQAKATKAGKEDSNVATATYTINLPEQVENIAAVNVLDPGKDFVFNNRAVVVHRKGNQMWIQDYEPTAGGALVYGDGLAYNDNDVLKTGWTGTTATYNGKKEIINLVAVTDGTKEAKAMKRTTLSENNINEYVLLENVTLEIVDNDTIITLPDSRGNVKVYDNFKKLNDFTIEEGFNYNVKGIVDVYKKNNTSTLEIYPLSIELNKKDVTLAFGDTPDIYVGNEVTLTVTGAPEGVNVTFECDPEDAVTFEGNKATFNTEGEVTITAKTAATDEYNAGEVSKTFNVQAKTTPTLTFVPNKVELYVGQEFTAPTLNGLPEGATVVYTVENENPEVVVATVENNVVAITGTAGKATVTATYAGSNQYNNTSASYPITISKKDVTLAFGDTPDIYVGNEVTLTVTGAPEGATVTFECAPEGAVTFDGNKATFKTEGPVTITAKTAATDEYNAGEVSKTFNVQAKKEAGLSFGENPNVEITLGDTFTAPQLVNPYNLPVTWTSSNPDVATVDQDGNVTLVAGAIGSTTITATYTTGEGSGYETGSARYTITVNDVVVALAAPTFAPAAGTYTEPKEVAIACATPGVTITYAIDGVDKGEYNGPFTISDGEHTVTATAKMGTRTVYTPATSSATYKINVLPAAQIDNKYYYLVNNALPEMYANVAGRRTLNFVADPADKAGTVFRIATDGNGKVLTLRSQACDIQDYAKRAMNYVPVIVQTVINKLNNTTDVDSISGAGNLLGENGLQALLDKFNECFDYNLYVEGNENAYRIYARTPSMQNVVDFYRDHKAQVDEKLPMLEDYINQVLAKIRSKVQAANLNPQVFEDFSLLTLWEEMGKKLIKPDSEENVKRFYEQVLTNKEYVWDFAYYTAKHYLDNIKGTTTYQNLINLHPEIESVYLDKLEEIRPETKFFIIQNGNEPDYVSETHIYITGNDAKTYWTLTPRTDYNVTFPAENVYNGQLVTTLYTDFAYDVPEGVTAYTVTGVKTVNEQAIAEIEALNGTVPAQTPVLLMTPAAKANVTKTVTLNTNNGTPIENELKGPDYLIKNYGINSPTVQAIFNMAAGLVPADMLAQYAYLKLRTSGTVNNKYFWNVNDALDSCIVVNQNNLQDCIVRCLSTKTGELAFSEHWKTETNKAFLVSETDEVIYLAKAVKPTFDPFPGSYNDAQTVAIDAGGAEIEYSTDGGDNWYPYTGPITVDKDMTIIARTEGVGETAEATGVYVINKPVETISIKGFKGYFQIKNNGNGKYANVAGRKTLNFVDDPADKAGTVIYADIQKDGKVLSLRSQAADLQRYADRAVSYVPEIVRLVAQKLNADGTGSILGANGLDAILAKFDESFDHHLYVDSVDGGYRIFGRTPSMQPVVDFYRENKDRVEAKLPDLEAFINSALAKLREKIGGSTVFTDFSLHQIWDKMEAKALLTQPTDDVTTMAFYREVLNNKNYVWDFAYQTALIYLNNVTSHPRWAEIEAQLGEYAQYIDMLEQVHPEFKYYIVQKDGKPDFISEGNTDIINNAARTIWTLEPRTTFNVNIDENNLFGCPLADGVGGYATTLYTDFAYDLPDGVTAYKVTEIDGDFAKTEAIGSYVPAQTPVLLMADVAGEKVLTLNKENGTPITGNLLVGADYFINEYKLKTPQVAYLFGLVKSKLGEAFYDNYVAEYEHLMYKNSGTVNNKYFWGLTTDDLDSCTYTENGVLDCVVRTLAKGEDGTKKLAFYSLWKAPANQAFLASTENPVRLSLRGDVNHDGYVNLIDVTDLIDRLLVIPDAEHLKACPYCSDVDGNGSVNIKDVTVLIDILLENPAPDPEGGDGN